MAAPSVPLASSDSVVPQGPFGGAGGFSFYDGVGDVDQITITYSSQVVCSVQTNYRQTAHRVFSAAEHGSKGQQVAVIKLDFAHGERLKQVKGTTAVVRPGIYNTPMVTSLTFITNRKTHGPYGKEDGQPFQSSPHGKVVGFFGRSGQLIDAFGTFTDFSDSPTDLVADGPWGGDGGTVYYDGQADKIKQIDVAYDEIEKDSNGAIISLNVTYDQGDKGFVSSKHGGAGGTTTPIVFGDDEYLAQVTGTTGPVSGLAHGSSTVVTSLSFITNKSTVYGPFGNAFGDPTFESRLDSQILGFYGRSGSLLDQLGAFVAAAPPPPVVESPRYGGHGGDAFYEGRGEISQIVVTYQKDLVAKLQLTYLQGGEQFVGAVHGGANGDKSGAVATIPLNSPDEYLVQVKGTHGPARGVEDLILSIQFITNKKTYGPYGNPGSGTPFASPKAGHVVGLFGRSGYWIDQIAVIVAPISKNPVAIHDVLRIQDVE